MGDTPASAQDFLLTLLRDNSYWDSGYHMECRDYTQSGHEQGKWLTCSTVTVVVLKFPIFLNGLFFLVLILKIHIWLLYLLPFLSCGVIIFVVMLQDALLLMVHWGCTCVCWCIRFIVNRSSGDCGGILGIKPANLKHAKKVLYLILRTLSFLIFISKLPALF